MTELELAQRCPRCGNAGVAKADEATLEGLRLVRVYCPHLPCPQYRKFFYLVIDDVNHVIETTHTVYKEPPGE